MRLLWVASRLKRKRKLRLVLIQMTLTVELLGPRGGYRNARDCMLVSVDTNGYDIEETIRFHLI